MKTVRVLAWVCSTVLAGASLPAQGDSPVGVRLHPFVLADQNGELVGLGDFGTTDVVVLFTMGVGCPISNLYIPEMRRLQERYRGSVQILGINPNAGTTQQEVAADVAEFEVSFPVLLDPEQRLIDMLGVERTAEAFVLDRQRIVRYHGRVSDRFGYTYKKIAATRDDLEEAILEVLADKSVTVPMTPPLGCLIDRRTEPDFADITYSRDIAPIIQNRCQSCHRPGEIAPFSLMSSADARQRAAKIKEVVVQERMPPWPADPRFGHFANDRSLTDAEIDKLVAWVDAGTPIGNPEDLPAPVDDVEGWAIDKPDLVYETRTGDLWHPTSQPGFRSEASFTFVEDAMLTALHPSPYPQQDLRSRSYEVAAVYPDGRREILLSIPQWDDDWQITYRLAEPKPMPKGTRLEGVAHYHDSANHDRTGSANPYEGRGWIRYTTERR